MSYLLRDLFSELLNYCSQNSSNFVNFNRTILRKREAIFVFFFAWTSRGFKISRHTCAQVARGLKTLGSLLKMICWSNGEWRFDRVVQHCDIMRFMINCVRHHKVSLTLILDKIVTVLWCMKNGTLCDVYCEAPWISLCHSIGHVWGLKRGSEECQGSVTALQCIKSQEMFLILWSQIEEFCEKVLWCPF